MRRRHGMRGLLPELTRMNHGLWVLYGWLFVELLMAAHRHGRPRLVENFWRVFATVVWILLVIWWALHWKLY